MRRHRLALSVFAFATIALVASCRPADPGSAVRRLARAIETERFTVGRLAGTRAWSACSIADSAAVVPVARCTRTSDAPLLRPTVSADLRILQFDSTPPALQVKASFDLRFPARYGVDRAIAQLEQARAATPTSTRVLNDLAVAYLEQAARDQTLRPLVAGLDVVERALERDSSFAPALFNRALLLERLYLLSSARLAWDQYVRLETDKGWRSEAVSHLTALSRKLDAITKADLRSSSLDEPAWDSTGIGYRIARSPNRAREICFEMLARWGRAWQDRDSSAVRRSLARVRVIARMLDSLHADPSVALALAAIDRDSGSAVKTTALARAHIDYAKGFELQLHAAFDDAVPVFERAATGFRSAGSPMDRWADVYGGAAQLFRSQFRAADELLHSVRNRTTAAQPSLLGKAAWLLGVSQLRRGAYELANAYYREATPLYAAAGESENRGAVAYLLTEVLDREGRRVQGDALALSALRGLSQFRGSQYLYLHLGAASAVARSDGFTRASLAMNREEVEVAATVGTPLVLAYSHLALGRSLSTLGRSKEAARELDIAMSAVDSIPPGTGQDRVRAEVLLSEGVLLGETDPRGAVRMLEPVVATHRRMKTDGALATALYQTSRFAQAAHDDVAARSALKEAIVAIERQNATFRTTEERSSFYETVENVFDAVTDREVTGGHLDSAFAYAERGRAAGWLTAEGRGDVQRGVVSLSTIATKVPDRTTFVEYAVLADRLIIWTASRHGIAQVPVAVSRTRIAELVDRSLAEMRQSRVDSTSARSQLFELLIQPIADRLAGASRMVVVTDRELTRLPLSALWDRRSSKYLIETVEVSLLPSAEFLARPSRGDLPQGATALVVGNPSPHRDTLNLPPLPGAAHEASRVAQVYGKAMKSRLLTDSNASRRRVLEQLRDASVFHFAGHAVDNAGQPELSYLALAAESSADSDELRTGEIGRMRLTNLRVVVLSACTTLNPRATRIGPVEGLAYSFLRAGAQATIGTLWDVADDSGEELLVNLHRGLIAGTRASTALRSAQLNALHGKTGGAAPIYWAAYVVTGF